MLLDYYDDNNSNNNMYYYDDDSNSDDNNDHDTTNSNDNNSNNNDSNSTRPSVADGFVKRGLEYGVRAPVFYGSKREKTFFHEYLQEACFVLTEIFESLWKPPGVYGRM